MENEPFQIELARQLAARLERLSADSHWAHQASGLRGSLLKRIEQFEEGKGGSEDLANLLEHGFMILEKAAREIYG